MGLISYFSISRESSPDIKIPYIFISLHQEGISPEDAQRFLLQPVEQKIRTIEGIKEIKGTAYENGGIVVVEFMAGHSVEKAHHDVREKVDAVRSKLPSEADEPIVNTLSSDQFPVLIIKLSGKIPQRRLYYLAKKLKTEIETRVSSVLNVNLVGNQTDVVEIIIDPAKIESRQISFDEVFLFFQRNNLVVSAGMIDTGKGRFSVRVPGHIESLDDVEAIPISVQGDAVVTLGDIASVKYTFKDPISFARDRGLPAIAIEVSKRAGENIIETVNKIKAVVHETQKTWPLQLQVQYAQDQSSQILDVLRELQNNLIFAVFLVIIVIFFWLGWRSAFLVSLSVPGSFLAGIWVLDLLGLTLNIVVLFSLILSVGMLVDGAIIVVEYADRKMMEGVSRKEAFLQATQRMAWPVIVSTSTILVVFLPLLFWPGVVGQFMKFLPITLLAVLIASILMALLFIPAFGFLMGGISKDHAVKYRETIVATEEGDLDNIPGFTGWYIKLLKHALNYPKKVIVGAIGFFMLVIISYAFFGHGVEFFPNIEPEQATIMIHARGNLSLEEQDELVKKVEYRILDMKELLSIYTRVGAGDPALGPMQGGQEESEDVIGVITLEFADWKTRRKVDDILEDIKKRTQDIAGIYVEISASKGGPMLGSPIQLNIYADDPKNISKTVTEIRQFMENQKGLTGINDNRSLPGIRWDIKIDRAQAAKFGANVNLVGMGIRLVTNGFKVATYRPDDALDEIDIILRYPKEMRTIDQLNKVRIFSSEGLVPISNFIETKPVPKVGFIHRSNSKEVISIKADVEPHILANDKVQELKAWLQSTNLAPGTHIEFKGEDEDQKATVNFLMKAFFIAIALICIILIMQFNSFIEAILVLSAVVMSIIGVLLGLLIMRQPFGVVMGGIGIISLAGIIVSNNILLIDTYKQLSRRFSDVREVIIRTGAQRLRPVILTKLTIILGLLPIMFGVNIDFVKAEITVGAPATQWWIQLSTAIVYGILFASPLTLIVTPCALMLYANHLKAKSTG